MEVIKNSDGKTICHADAKDKLIEIKNVNFQIKLGNILTLKAPKIS